MERQRKVREEQSKASRRWQKNCGCGSLPTETCPPPCLEEFPTALFGLRRFPRLAVVAPWDIGAMTKSETASQKLREAGGCRGKRSPTPALEGSARRRRAKPALPLPEGWELSEVLKGGGASCYSRQTGRSSAGSDCRFPDPRGRPQTEAWSESRESGPRLLTARHRAKGRSGVGILSAGHWDRISPGPFFSRRKQKNPLTKDGY